MSIDTVISSFDLQAKWCDEMGSRFTADLMRAAASDMREGGPIAALIGDWPGNPLADALMMRFAGALHAAALSKRDEKLAALYPANDPDWSMEKIWPVARDFVVREDAWVRDFLKSPPQTNETRRTIAFLPGFLALARETPLHLLEFGASAGLNQSWDGFRYGTASWSWGKAGGPLIDTDWRGPPPADLDVIPVIASRAACDQAPLDVRNPDHVLKLDAYIWADQPQRTTRLHAAIKLARENDVRVERADAAEWLERKLAGPLPEGTTVIYHSVVWQYLTPETRDAITRIVETTAQRADKTHRLAWLQFETARIFGLEGSIDQMALHLRLWPGEAEPEQRRIFLRSNGHASWVEVEAKA